MKSGISKQPPRILANKTKTSNNLAVRLNFDSLESLLSDLMQEDQFFFNTSMPPEMDDISSSVGACKILHTEELPEQPFAPFFVLEDMISGMN